MKVALMCGSLGARSANAELLRIVESRMTRCGHKAVPLSDLAQVPAFEPALVDDPPAVVADLRRTIRACDAVMIAAPEYAAGLAGSTKNVLDWLVGDATIDRKVLGVASAGTTGGNHAIEQLVRTISWQGGWVVATLGVAAPRTKSDEQGVFTDHQTIEAIISWTDLVLGAVEGTATHRAGLLSSVVVPFGIDPARFGSIT